jgi:flagellar biosynthesis protein FlhF
VRVKSYYGHNIREALDRARRELGADASILASRHVEGGPHAYEVVCGIPDDGKQPITARRALSRTEPLQTHTNEAPPDGPAKRTIDKVRSAFSRTRTDVGELRSTLLADGFTEDLAAEILAGVSQRQRQSARKQSGTQEALAAELAARLRVLPQLGRQNSKKRVVALVGPPGVGKTTTVVKLAVRYGLRAQGPLHIVSADAYRVGGTDMLRAYASGMAAQFDTAASAAALSQLIEGQPANGLMLIDTAGLSAADTSGASAVASLLSRHMDVDVHLVLPATLSAASASAAVERFRPFLPSKLLITAADEMPACRIAVAQALLHDKPVSFIGTGPMVPEDLMEATVTRLCGHSEERDAETISAA